MNGRPAVPRTQVRRLPDKQVADLGALHQILATALVAHVAVVVDGQPYVLPVGIALDGEQVLVHGSTASRTFRALAAGAPTCLTVTLLDGLVLARSQFESSMHYRSAMVLGVCRPVPDDDKVRALGVLTDRLMPGRGADARPASAKELKATSVLALPLQEWSVKVSAAPPDDDDADLDRPVWAGTLPLACHWGEPVPAPDLRGTPPLPAYLDTWPADRK